MKVFSELKRNLKKDFSGMKAVRIALLGDSATQFLAQALRGMGYELGFDLDIWEADFNQIERQIADPTSELYAHQADIVIVFQSAHKLLGKFNKKSPDAYPLLAEDEMDNIASHFAILAERSAAKLIYYNYTEIDDGVFGNFSNKTPSSFLFQLRKLNYLLMEFASAHDNFFVCDLSAIQNHLGKPAIFHTSVYINTEMVLSIDALPHVAARTLDLIAALSGQFRKCVILDLDNTTWGGIIGDDGIENIQVGSLGIGKAFSEFQYWVKKLKNRGIIVAVCSKNTDHVAREPFEKHPDMVLRMDDVSVFVANWENKADNIRQIQSILNIGFDSMVFLDDNPFERNLVRESLPEVHVPEMPEDPADYLEFLYTQNLFETVSFSGEDAQRTKRYQIEAQRAQTQQKFTNEEDFLQSLGMVSAVVPFNAFNRPRVAQLSQRSNQFNLRTMRYTDADIERLAQSSGHLTLTFTLEDKFGDNGLICVIILEKEDATTAFIDTWLMSCRVLKRGMENFVLNTIVDTCKANGISELKGEYLPTAKNAMVENHYEALGFLPESGFWKLDISSYEPKPTYITAS